MRGRRLLALGLLGLALAGSAACSPTDNCLTRHDCHDEVTVVSPEGVRTDMLRWEAEVAGLDAYIERPAADIVVCEVEPHLC